MTHNSCRRDEPGHLEATYYASSLVLVGEGHRRAHVNCQDHAVVRRCEHGIVLVVADGISLSRDEAGHRITSHNEAGAWLAAEVAAAAALAALEAGALDDVPRYVASSVAGALGPAWAALGRQRGRQGLASTLLVGCVTARGARVWASGDGAWGIVVAGTPASLVVQHVHAAGSSGRGGWASGGLQANGFAVTATTQAAVGAAAVENELRPVVHFDGSVVALHVASDGVYDEPALVEHLCRPVRSRSALERTLVRAPDCDDLAVAWVATRFAGLLGEEASDA